MKTQTLLAAMLLTLGAGVHATDTADDRGCDRFLGRACTALEQGGYERGRPHDGAERERVGDRRSAGCNAFVGRTCSAPERAAFDAAARLAKAPPPAPSRCEDLLGRACSKQERLNFDQGRGHGLALADRPGAVR